MGQRFSNQYVLSTSLQLKISEEYSVLQKNYRIFSLKYLSSLQPLFLKLFFCSRHLLWDPISREISDHTSPSTSLPWSKENRKLTTLFIPLYCPHLYINLNCAGPHFSLLYPVFCFFCALIWKSEGWAWIIRSFWRTWEHLCCSEATSVCSLLLQLSPELSTIQFHRSKLIWNDIVGGKTLTCILLVVFTHLALLLLGRATPGFHALFSTFRTNNTIIDGGSTET